MWKPALYDYFWQLSCELWFILYQSRGPKRIRQLWSVALAPGLRGAGINSPGNVTRQQKFLQLVQSFWISFWRVLVFLLFSLVLLRFAFSLFSVSHFKVFRYCCKYFVKNGIQSVSKMLLHQVCWQSQKLTFKERGGRSQLPRVKSIVNWPKSQVFMDGATGQRGPVKTFFITNPGNISPMQQMSIVSLDKVMPQNEVFSFAMPCNSND